MKRIAKSKMGQGITLMIGLLCSALLLGAGQPATGNRLLEPFDVVQVSMKVMPLMLNALLPARELSPDPENPLAPLEKLVGGVWQSTLNVPGMESMDVQMVFEWGPGDRTIKYRVYSVRGETKQLFTEGIYVWHPGRKQIVFLEFGGSGLSEGSVTPFGEGLQFTWSEFTENGLNEYRDTLRFRDENHWTTHPHFKAPTGWRAVMPAATYQRREPETAASR